MKINSMISLLALTGLMWLLLFNCKKEAVKVVPTITVAIVTDITAVSAKCGGEITSDGGATVTSRGVCWSSKNQSPSTSDNKTSDGTGLGIFSSNLSGLSPGTKYYIRAYATNSVGTAYYSQEPFTTLALAPVLTTTELSAITSTSATGGGNITNDGGSPVTSRGVCWSTTPSPTISDSKTTDGTGSGSFTSYISGLISGTTYYIKAYATNSLGTSYGNLVTVKTIAGLPSITSDTFLAPTTTTATGGGTITYDGGSPITSRGVCWSTSPTPTISDSRTSEGTGSGSFTSSITGLTPGTIYYFRAYATNNIGTSYGNALAVSVPKNDVYVAGYQSSGNTTVAKVWKNGIPIFSTKLDDTQQAEANSVFVSGNDVYVAGYELLANKEATVWKNGVPTFLRDGTNSVVQSVFVSGDDVLMAGYGYNEAKVWKNGAAISLTDGKNNAYAVSVFVSGSDVYVAGKSGGYAVVWKNGTPTYLTGYPTQSGASSVYVSGSDVYVAGGAVNQRTGAQAAVWKNGTLTYLTIGDIWNTTEAHALSVYVLGSDVYVAGYESNGTHSVAKVWKNGAPTSLTDGRYDAEANSVYVSGSDVYVAGFEDNGGALVAKVWKNGIPTSLAGGGMISAKAYSVFVK